MLPEAHYYVSCRKNAESRICEAKNCVQELRIAAGCLEDDVLLSDAHTVETVESFRRDIFTDNLVASKNVLHAVKIPEARVKHGMNIRLRIQPGLEDFALGLAGNLGRLRKQLVVQVLEMFAHGFAGTICAAALNNLCEEGSLQSKTMAVFRKAMGLVAS
jgi:hypothetical protein